MFTFIKEITNFIKVIPIVWKCARGRWYVCRNADNDTLLYITSTVKDAVEYCKTYTKSDQATIIVLEEIVRQASRELKLRKWRDGL